MSVPKWLQFWTSLHGEHEYYETHSFHSRSSIAFLERGMSCMRVYRNKDGTWSAMPNWMGKDKPYATNYATYNTIPLDIQSKIGVLLMTEPGGEWLDGVGRRVDDDVFWLEDG